MPFDGLFSMIYNFSMLNGTRKETASEMILGPILAVFHGKGITAELLAAKLKAELEAETSRRMKLRGRVNKDALEKGSSVVAEAVDGNEIESVVEWQEINWGTRQRARIDAQKLLDLYPAERHRVDVNKEVKVVIRHFRNDKLK